LHQDRAGRWAASATSRDDDDAARQGGPAWQGAGPAEPPDGSVTWGLTEGAARQPPGAEEWTDGNRLARLPAKHQHDRRSF
jgi:hypothetical protein